MEEYLQYMKTLRCQMNDVEDHAAKISFEEQMLITGIQALEHDLASAKLEMQKLNDEAERLTKEKGQICFQLLNVQKKVSVLESDSQVHIQSLELIHQERVSLSAKLVDKSDYYAKVTDELNTKFQEQQDQVRSRSPTVERRQHFVGNGEAKNQNLHSAITRFDEIRELKAQAVAENVKMKQFEERLTSRASNFKQDLREMDLEALEKEQAAISSEKTGETEFIISLQDQMNKLQGLSQAIKCSCGEEYKIELDGRA